MPTKTLLTALAVLFAATVVAASAAAPDAKPPRIVAAAMRDADGDARTDAVRLTYSERVRHVADRDGKYPFRVAGYRIRSVAAASGKTIVLALAEPRGADGRSHPAVSYRHARAGAVVDRSRNQAAAQVFRATRAHGNSAPSPTPQPTPPPPPPPPTVLDKDGDGVADDKDCAPNDKTIRPGAPDRPDLAFVDSNCDGIDGDEK